MDEYIKREALFRSIADDVAPFNVAMVFRHIRNAPAADVAPVRHGHWIENGDCQICSECGEEHCWDEYRAAYCDSCGAKMDGKDGDGND